MNFNTLYWELAYEKDSEVSSGSKCGGQVVNHSSLYNLPLALVVWQVVTGQRPFLWVALGFLPNGHLLGTMSAIF